MRQERLVIVSPVRDEAAHVAAVVEAMAAQTRPPDEWIVVDDRSSDGTFELLECAARHIPFMRVLRAPRDAVPEGADRLSHAAAPRVFNFGLRYSRYESDFSHVGKLDGDIELPPDYFERLLAHFREDPLLGIGGGCLVERSGDDWEPHGVSDLAHVRGALKLWSRECYDAIGGVREVLGWDGIDEVLARMHGYGTRSFPELVARHHRPTGSAQGRLRGHLRWGRAMYVEGYPTPWILARSFKVALSRPWGISAVAYLYGYAHAVLSGVRRFDEPGYRKKLRSELFGRVALRLRRRAHHDRRKFGDGDLVRLPTGMERAWTAQDSSSSSAASATASRSA